MQHLQKTGGNGVFALFGGTSSLLMVSNPIISGRRGRLSIRSKEMAVLEAIALAKFYGSVPAVREVSFRLEPGQVLGYLGPNGSGKSTTVKVLTGLLQPTHGQVLFEG